VAGGDTVSALAAGCPVVVKAHAAHPGTSELVARAILAAGAETAMPNGIFSLLHGASHAVGQALVAQPPIQAVGFTGSFRGGKALFDAAAARPQPIPVFAEMGSANPVFILPEALAANGAEIAKAFAASVTLGGGQFCTSPGLGFVVKSPAADAFVESLGGLLGEAPAATLVHATIKKAYDQEVAAVGKLPGVDVVAQSEAQGPNEATAARPALLAVDQTAWAAEARLGQEVYGPATLAVRCSGREDVLEAARALEGHLTATVHGTKGDLDEYGDLLNILATKAGRVIVGGMPTGVEVSPAMHHGGPWPAATDPRATSVGTAAIFRFARPVCYQNVPEGALPEPLQSANPRKLWRLVDGQRTRGGL
jgi:alpha-ketoglutaric semialdehyde dehydrogenase